MNNFKEQYKSPEWQKIRLLVLQRDNFTCQFCGSMENQLQVHHHYYVSNCKIWEYPIESLITLCSECHEVYASDQKDLEKGILYELYNSGMNRRILHSFWFYLQKRKNSGKTLDSFFKTIEKFQREHDTLLF